MAYANNQPMRAGAADGRGANVNAHAQHHAGNRMAPAASAHRAPAARHSPAHRRVRSAARRRIALKCVCALAVLLAALLWPATCPPDDLPPSGDAGVVQPLPIATPTPTPAPTAEPVPARVTISAAGDCTLGYDPQLGYSNSLPNELERQGGDYSYFFRDVYPVFASDDLTVVNLECAFTESNSRVEGKTFCFKGDPLYRNMLTEGSIEVVSLGNNHARDYGDAGFNDTVDALREAGVGFAVNGISCVREVNGIRVGFLSYRNHTPELDSLKADIASLRAQCDVVVCSFHWGEEYRNVANSEQLERGRAAVDYGADLVLGHHPHVIGSIEQYKGVYICYSLGNFCFGGNRNPEDKDSFIFRQTFELTEQGAVSVGIEIVPCRISSTDSRNDYQPTIYGREDALRVLERLNSYSAPLEYGVALDESALGWQWIDG